MASELRFENFEWQQELWLATNVAILPSVRIIPNRSDVETAARGPRFSHVCQQLKSKSHLLWEKTTR
jgi:hypothetical protein